MTIKDQAHACRYAAKEYKRELSKNNYPEDDRQFLQRQIELLENAALNLEKFLALKEALKESA